MRRLTDATHISGSEDARKRHDLAPITSTLTIVLLSLFCASSAFGQMIRTVSAEESLQMAEVAEMSANAPVRFGMPESTKALPEFVYPVKAENFQIEGRVIVHFMVNEDGKATNAQIVKSLGYGFDEEVLRVLRHGRFKPVIDDAGNLQPTRFVVAVDFRLGE